VRSTALPSSIAWARGSAASDGESTSIGLQRLPTMPRTRWSRRKSPPHTSTAT
jgi:hypothetical protein